MNAPDVETQAIMALCHHEKCQPGCVLCKIRADEAAGYLVRLCSEAIKSLDNK